MMSWKMIQIWILKYILAACCCCLSISLEMSFGWHRRYLIFFFISLCQITWQFGSNKKIKVVQFNRMKLNQCKHIKLSLKNGFFSHHTHILNALTKMSTMLEREACTFCVITFWLFNSFNLLLNICMF